MGNFLNFFCYGKLPPYIGKIQINKTKTKTKTLNGDGSREPSMCTMLFVASFDNPKKKVTNIFLI